MKKMITFFERNHGAHWLAYDEVSEGAEWVANGEGYATVKIDGTACMVKDGRLYKRYEHKRSDKPIPDGFIPAQSEPRPDNGHWPGWLAVDMASPADRWHVEALSDFDLSQDGTYELIGPKIQGNLYHLDKHQLIKHGAWRFEEEPPRQFSALKEWFARHAVEGIVWHHPDGHMVKLKRRDFGFPWPDKSV